MLLQTQTELERDVMKACICFLHHFLFFKCSGVVGRAIQYKSEVLGFQPRRATFQLGNIALMDSHHTLEPLQSQPE